MRYASSKLAIRAVEGVVLGTRCQVPAIELGHEIELPALIGSGHGQILDILDQVLDLALPGVDVGSLIDARQEGLCASSETSATGRPGAIATKPGRFWFFFGAQAIGRPGPHAGPRQPLVAAIHQTH